MGMKYLKYDLYRYFYPDDKCQYRSFYGKLKLILLTQGIWAIIVFRMGAWCVRNRTRVGFPVRLLLPILTLFQKLIEISTGIDIPFNAQIGKGLYIGHFGQIILSSRTVMGEFCNLSQGVTIGEAGRGGERYVPVIGDRVYIGPGAKIFGKVNIGSDVAIGANAVVTKDLPDNAVAVGIPARIISYESSKDFVNYNQRKSETSSE